MVRSGLLSPDVQTHYYPLYGVTCGVIMIAIGLLFVEFIKDKVNA